MNVLPLETCMSFGAISTQMVENGGARRITKEEAIDILHKSGIIPSKKHP